MYRLHASNEHATGLVMSDRFSGIMDQGSSANSKMTMDGLMQNLSTAC